MSKIRISTTINLGNYENLKIDIERNVKTLEDSTGLRNELYDIITLFASNATDPTRDLILQYRNRIGLIPTTRTGERL